MVGADPAADNPQRDRPIRTNRLVHGAASDDSDVVVGQYGYDP